MLYWTEDSPCAVSDDVSSIEGVDRYILPHFAHVVTKERLPTAEQYLVLQIISLIDITFSSSKFVSLFFILKIHNL